MDNLEKKLLARVTVNYLFLAQFETFRASLKNLRTASPDITVGILHAIVQNLGHLEGISWSRSISSPSQLAWLALGELLELSRSGLINQKDGLLWGLDYQWLTHKIEALFLLQQLIELLKIKPNLPLDYISEIKTCSSEMPQRDTLISLQEVQDEKSASTSDGLLQADIAPPSEADVILSEGISILNQIYDSWEAQLRSFISNAMANILQNKGLEFQDTEASKTGSSMSDKQKKIFHQISVCEPQLFTALCWIIARQKERITTAPASAVAKSDENDEGQVEDETMSGQCSFIDDGVFLKEIQDALLTVIKGKLDHVPVQDCVWHLRFLHTDFGVSESAYRDVIQKIVRKAIIPEYAALEDKNGTALLRTYQEVLASGNTTLLSMVETALDLCLKEAGELFRSANEPSVAPPLRYLHECLKCWRGEESMLQESSLSEIEVMHYCMRQLCHYSRVSGSHMFDLVMDAALSAIKTHQYQKAVDVLSMFPRLQPLAAIMGWDLLAGDTTARRKMMELLWKTKPVEFTAYRKHSEEPQSCCIDYLCDQLCYHLEVAYFVARINSGLDWTPSYALFHVRGNKNGAKLTEEKPADGFVANLVLERLAMHSPIRVLFDVVPDLKMKHARALIKMFPISSIIAECKRLQDLELLELHYGIQAAVLALGAMERSMSSKENTKLTTVAIKLLEELHDHILSISNIPRRLFFMNIVVALLHMDDASGQPLPNGLDRKLSTLLADVPDSDDSRRVTAVGFIGHLLQILRSCLPSDGVEFEDQSPLSAFPKGFPSRAGLQAWMWRTSILQHFVDDWEWRLAVLQRLAPSSQREWDWKEALAVLRAAPSTLLNMCVQRAQYDLGEEAVHRFALPPEDEAALQLAEWVDGAVARATVDEVVSRVAEGASSPAEALKLAGIRAPLAPLASVLLCVDVAAASARAIDMSKQLLHQARLLLAEISSGSQRQVSNHAEQIQEACILSVSKRVLQCLQDLLDKVCTERDQTLQALLSGMDMVNASLESAKHGHKYRALNILQQTIEDAHNGKRQFLSGKLHNLVKALADEDTEENSIRPLNSYTDRKHVSFPENGYLLGYGVRVPVKQPVTGMSAVPGDHSGEATFFPLKGTGKRFLGPLTAKPSAYLSAFILYVATIGDIVDGVDTTHDFNFFSLVYERCNDLLTRLVFERGSADAAGKIAEMMGADLVQEVISACVPPVFPPESSKGWARILLLPSQPAQFSDNHIDSAATDSTNGPITGLYPLKLDVVKHLSTLSPVRAILACVFGTSTFSKTTRTIDGISTLGTETDRSFYEFALDQSDRFPTLNRWIQMQANIQRLSDFPTPSRKGDIGQENDAKRGELSKRKREIESEMESEEEEEKQSFFGLHPATHSWHETVERHSKEKHGHSAHKSKASELERNGSTSLVIDWENESIYEDAVQRLLEEGKMVDALALADRYIRGGAPDYLLQLLIENGNDSATQTTQWQGYPTQHSFSNISWQYCIRLRDKRLAAMLAIKHMKKWDLDAAIDVLTMCSCHLPAQDSLHGEVVRLKQSLQLYGRILRADSRFSNWQEVESLCQRDPEELALRLAGRGAVTAALEVAETYKLREELRRELQGRQVVKLLTLDPTNGGGPAEALRFLGSLKVREDALPVAMAAMEQLPTLHSKQLLVHFFLKKQVTRLSEDQLDHLHKLALGLHMLGALPIPWQQRCSALHQHPQLILETLLMWKQLQVASELLNAFPSLRDDNLILTYAAKAISVSIYPNYERRPAVQAGSSKPSNRITPSGRGNFGASMSNLQREARRAFSWTTKDSGNKIVPKETSRKRKSTALSPSQKAAWDAMTGVHEEKVHSYAQDSFERLTPVTMTEGWVLTGDPVKDNTVRSSHRYESAPCITLFKALLALCSSETVAVKACVRICIKQMKQFLNSEQLPSNASSETVERAFHATEAFVQALLHAKVQLKKLLGSQDSVASGETARDSGHGSSETGGNEGTAKSLNVDSELSEDLSELLFQVVEWLSRAELLQSLLGSGVMVSLDDVLNEDAAKNLRDRLINGEQYSMAVYCCTKCKLDAFPVWKAWAHALVQMEHYAQARVKLKQALRLHKGDAAPIIEDLILTMESSPPVDVSSVRSLYDHMAKNASTILDDSLSADAYLNVLYMPSSFTKSERSRRSSEDSVDSFAAFSAQANGEDGPRSNLDRSRYDECVYYLQEYARQDLLPFMFRHGHYADACLLFFPPKSVPLPPTTTNFSGQPPTSSPQRPDPLATDCGTIDDLCELCVAYGAIPVLERVIATRELGSGGQDPAISQHTAAALARVCSYCETHKLFNHLYRFQVLKKDHVAAGLCCIQLFLNSANQDQALRHLERAKMHFVEGISARQQVNEAQRSSTKASRTKSPSERFSEEELLRFSTRVSLQMDVVRCFSDSEGPPWKHSLFGNPNDADTQKRRAEVAEALAERNNELAFQVISQFGLAAVHIYAAVAASLAERKKSNQLAELFKNIKATISDDDLDQVIAAAIMVFVNKHRERPDRLIEMLSSSHRKVLACVACGRLKAAFQIASRSQNLSDVQYVAHQARQTGSVTVEDMCKQWISRHNQGY